MPLASLTEANLGAYLVSASAALEHLPAQTIRGENQREDVRQGRSLPTELDPAPIARVLDGQGTLLALARSGQGRLQPFKVFPQD